jgi:hypothetical protein
MSYFLPGYIAAGYYEGDVPAAPVVPITLPLPGDVRGATAYGNLKGLAVIYHQNPGPYSAESIFMWRTWAGQRLIGKKMPSTAIIADDIGRFATLMTMSPISINTVPIGNDLIGSLSTSEKPQTTVTAENRDKFWSRLVMTEPLLLMPAGSWQHFGGGDSHLLLQGQIERVVIRQAEVSVTFGEP